MPKAPKKDEKEAEDKEKDEALDEELEDTFPASDPPSATSPGRGVTGPEVKRGEE